MSKIGWSRWLWCGVSVLLAVLATQAREPYLYPYRPWDAIGFFVPLPTCRRNPRSSK